MRSRWLGPAALHRLRRAPLLRAAGAWLCVMSVCDCVGVAAATTGTHNDVDVVELAATADGVVLDDATVRTAAAFSAGAPRAGVTWSSFFSPGGGVLWFADRTLCWRNPRRLGVVLADAGYRADSADDNADDNADDSADDSADADAIGAAFVHLDLSQAEEQALGRGEDLATARPWVVVSVVERDPSAWDAAKKAAEARGVAAARQLLRAGARAPVRVAAVRSTREQVELRLSSGSAALSEAVGVVVEGPPADPTALVSTLKQGPSTTVECLDCLVVQAFDESGSARFSPPPALHTPQDARWQQALESAGAQLGGCGR